MTLANAGQIRVASMENGLEYIDVLIDVSEANDESVAVNLRGRKIVAVETPTPMEAGTTSLTLQASDLEGGTYKPVVDIDGAALSITTDPATAEYIALDPALFQSFWWTKLIPAVAQSSDITIRLWLRRPR